MDKYEIQQAPMHASSILSPLLNSQPEPSPLFFEELQNLFTDEKLWDLFIAKLDPKDAIDTASLNIFHSFSDAATDDENAEAEPENDEEKQPEMNPVLSDFTPGDSTWTEKGKTWNWSRQAIDFQAIDDLNYIEIDGLATHLYNIFCVELGTLPWLKILSQITLPAMAC